MKKIKENNKIRFVAKIAYWLVLIILLLIAGLTVISALDIPGGYKLLAVRSGSMEPAVKLGSIVAVKPAREYQEGDIISFTDPSNPKYSVTHRIFEVSEGGTTFTTKGDANDTPDAKEVSKGRVLGKVILTIPLLGYLVAFAKTKLGFVLFIIVPALFIIYTELVNIKNEAAKLITARKVANVKVTEGRKKK